MKFLIRKVGCWLGYVNFLKSSLTKKLNSTNNEILLGFFYLDFS